MVAPLSKTKIFGPFPKSLCMSCNGFFLGAGVGHRDANFANIKTLSQLGIPLKPTTRALHGIKTCDNFFEKNSRDTQWVLVGYHGETKNKKMMVGFMKSETLNSMGIFSFR
jgi:hypothetical protein